MPKQGTNAPVDPSILGRLLLVHHVAKRLNVSRRTIRYWAQTGQLTGYKDGLKIWRFREQDVEDYRDIRDQRRVSW
jgi:excisionase family DNA binding protein